MQEKNYQARNNYRCLNVIACNIHVEEKKVELYCHPAVIVSGVRLTTIRRRRELTLSDLVWCHGSIC